MIYSYAYRYLGGLYSTVTFYADQNLGPAKFSIYFLVLLKPFRTTEMEGTRKNDCKAKRKQVRLGKSCGPACRSALGRACSSMVSMICADKVGSGGFNSLSWTRKEGRNRSEWLPKVVLAVSLRFCYIKSPRVKALLQRFRLLKSMEDTVHTRWSEETMKSDCEARWKEGK